MEKDVNWSVYGFEIFIAWFAARALQEWVIPLNMWILVPLAWLLIHALFGKWIEKHLTKKLW